MAYRQFQKSAGGIFSTLVVVLLLAVTVGLYLQIVMLDPATPPSGGLVPQASVQVLEGDELPTMPSPEPLPADQMDLILQVFAPAEAAAK